MAYVSVVTGGAGGMGIDICKRLAKETKVIAIDFQESRIEVAKQELAGLDVEFMLVDCTKLDEVKAVAEKAQSYGEVKYLCHAAGISDMLGDHQDTPEEIAVNNVEGAKNVLAVFADIIAEGGSIVTIASMTSYVDLTFTNYKDAFEPAMKGDLSGILKYGAGSTSTTYAVTKTFLRWLTLSYIGKVTGRGARINSISPGFIWTPMTEAIENRAAGSITALAYIVPQMRLGQPSDIGEVVDFLNKAAYVNGTDILVDGGYYFNGGIDQID